MQGCSTAGQKVEFRVMTGKKQLEESRRHAELQAVSLDEEEQEKIQKRRAASAERRQKVHEDEARRAGEKDELQMILERRRAAADGLAPCAADLKKDTTVSESAPANSDTGTSMPDSMTSKQEAAGAPPKENPDGARTAEKQGDFSMSKSDGTVADQSVVPAPQTKCCCTVM